MRIGTQITDHQQRASLADPWRTDLGTVRGQSQRHLSLSQAPPQSDGETCGATCQEWSRESHPDPGRVLRQRPTMSRSPMGFAGRSGRIFHPDRSEQSVPRPISQARQKTVLIGASTGGIDALIKVLSEFSSNCPATVIVQHTGHSFGASLAKLLSSRCAAEVVLTETGVEISAGRVCVVAGTSGHAELCGPHFRQIRIVDGEPVNGHMPSIDRLFQSAVPIAKRIEAAVLTGMGHDGAAGLLALRQAGAGTLVQDQETSVVYGMPRVAWEAGAADRQLPIAQIGPALLAAAGGQSE